MLPAVLVPEILRALPAVGALGARLPAAVVFGAVLFWARGGVMPGGPFAAGLKIAPGRAETLAGPVAAGFVLPRARGYAYGTGGRGRDDLLLRRGLGGFRGRLRLRLGRRLRRGSGRGGFYRLLGCRAGFGLGYGRLRRGGGFNRLFRGRGGGLRLYLLLRLRGYGGLAGGRHGVDELHFGAVLGVGGAYAAMSAAAQAVAVGIGLGNFLGFDLRHHAAAAGAANLGQDDH